MNELSPGYGLLLRHVNYCVRFSGGADSVPFAIGMRLGLTVAMRHPEWAQAFLSIIPSPEGGPTDELMADRLVEDLAIAETAE